MHTHEDAYLPGSAIYSEAEPLAKSPDMRERVLRLESELGKLPQVDLKTRNIVMGRMIARTITVPAGVALTGATHKKDHINIFQGDISVSTDDGLKRFTGQYVLPTKAGHKRVGFAHADTEWTTIVQTDLTDLHEIENEVVFEADRLQTRAMELAGAEPLKVEG